MKVRSKKNFENLSSSSDSYESEEELFRVDTAFDEPKNQIVDIFDQTQTIRIEEGGSK